jgi:hypothetical protein
MVLQRVIKLFLIIAGAMSAGGCSMIHTGSKHSFDDGTYRTRRLDGNKVYVLHVDDDTIAVFPVLEFKDSTAILTTQGSVYASRQRKFRDNKYNRSFYKPSINVDAMTIPLKYRPTTDGFPNQVNTNFAGAVYVGYRLDEFRLIYKRDPLNVYRQSVKHSGYSLGLFAGIGSTPINGSTLNNQNLTIQYDGALLLTGIAGNMAVGNLTFGISLGPDFLLDNYRKEWIYEGKPAIGFTLGLNIN